MIPGDIDLTESLDFRKVVRKETPQLPSNWGGKNLLNTDISSYNNVINISTTSSSNRLYSATINSNSTVTTYFNEDIEIYDSYDSWNSISWSEYDSVSTTLSYADNSSSYTFYWNTSEVSTLKYNWTQESETDIFGNTIPVETPIPKIPWDTTKPIPSYYWNNRITWDKWTVFKPEQDIPSIPWETDDYWIKPLKSPENFFSIIKESICWLKDKTESFIRGYFEDKDDVDLSYLTNMNWIRVHDAVID